MRVPAAIVALLLAALCAAGSLALAHEPHEQPAAGHADHADHGADHGDEMEAMEHPALRTTNPVAHFFFWLGKFHSPMVNFPIALLGAAAVAEILRLLTGRAIYDPAARYCVSLGSLTAVIAVILGWLFEGWTLHVDDPILNIHRWLGTATGCWALLTLTLSEIARRGPPRSRTWTAYRLVLFIGAALVIATGYFGGAMVYGINHYSWQ